MSAVGALNVNDDTVAVAGFWAHAEANTMNSETLQPLQAKVLIQRMSAIRDQYSVDYIDDCGQLL